MCSVFSQCGYHKDALEAFEKVGCWEQVFVAASLLHYTEPQKMEAGRRIAREMCGGWGWEKELGKQRRRIKR